MTRTRALVGAACVLLAVAAVGLPTVLVHRAVERAASQWRGGAEVTVFFDLGSSRADREVIEAELASMPGTDRVTAVDQAAAHEEFTRRFSSSPDLVGSVAPADLPASVRVSVPDQAAARAIDELFRSRPGVREVVYAEETVRTLSTVSRALRLAVPVLAGAGLLALASLVALIVSTPAFRPRGAH